MMTHLTKVARASLKVPLAWALACIAGSAGLTAQAAPHELASLPRTTEEWRDNCLIYTTAGVEIPGPFEVFGDPSPLGSPRLPYRSDVCSKGVANIGGSGMFTEIPVGAPTLLDVAVIAPTLNLNRASQTSDCVFDTATGGLNISPDASIVCPQNQRQDEDLSGMPDLDNDFLPFPVIIPGTQDLTVTAGNEEILDPGPGIYRNVVLGSTASLVFDKPGEYHFQSITSEVRADKVFLDVQAADVSILVKGCMYLGHRSRVNELDFRLFKVFVEGTDGDCQAPVGETEPSTAFTFDGDGRFNACYVYSPNGSQTWRGSPKVDNTYTTQVFATNFYTRGRGQRVRLSQPEDGDCFAPVDTDVMCEAKVLDPEVITLANATVRATVKLSNSGSATFAGLIVKDTMDPELSFGGSTNYTGAPTNPNASGGPPTWTFDPLNVPVGQSELSYNVNVTGLAPDEEACNTVTLMDQQGTVLSNCDACVTSNVAVPVAQCDEKIITPNVVFAPNAEVDVQVYISNPSAVEASPIVISDAMGPKMTYVAGSAMVGGVPIADPMQGPPGTWTFPEQSLEPFDSLLLTYRVSLTSLNVNEVVRNDVSVSTGDADTRLVVSAAIEGQGCDATVTRRGQPVPVPVPALGLLGLSLLTALMAIGGAAWRGRRGG